MEQLRTYDAEIGCETAQNGANKDELAALAYRRALVDLASLFDRNPAYSALYAEIIRACDNQLPEQEAANIAESLKSSVSQTQGGASIVATLVRRGALERTILVNGDAYEGSVEELQADESLPDDAAIEFLVQATFAGIDAAETYRAESSPAALFAADPLHAEGYRIVLSECSDGEGRSTAQLQDALIAGGIIKPGMQSSQELHASYFTSKLEKHGALVWDRKRWRMTAEGHGALDALK